jgi:hypothetical protein
MSKPKTSKVTSAQVSATSASPIPPASAIINPIPTSVSEPPQGWVQPVKLGRRGRRPKNGMNLSAPTLAAELRESGSALAQELGPKAVDPQQLAAALDQAYGWDGAEEKASKFHLYVRAERRASWDAALTLMGGMKLGVRFAVARDATFADRFPKVAKAFAATRRPKTAAGGQKGAASGTKGAKSTKSATVAAEAPAAVAPETAGHTPTPAA